MLRKFTLISLFLLLGRCVLPAQDEIVDSLRNLLSRQTGVEKNSTQLYLSYYLYEYDIEEARHLAWAALQSARQNGNKSQEKLALSLVGEYYYNVNQCAIARSYFRKSHKIKSGGSESATGYNLVLWANTYCLESRYDSATVLFNQAVPALEAAENLDFLQYAYVSYANFLMDQYRLQEAGNILDKALAMATTRQTQTDVADVLLEKGHLANLQDEYTTARELLVAADSLIPGEKYSYLRLMCKYYQGYVEYNLGNYFKAITCLRDILSRQEVEQYEDIKANIFALIGKIYVVRGEFELALKSYLDAVKIMERLNLRKELGETYSSIAWLYFKQFNDVECEVFVRKAILLTEQIDDAFGSGHAHSVWGSLYTAQGKWQEGLAMHQRALEYRTRIHSRSGIAESNYNLSTAYEKMGQIDKALAYAEDCLKIDLELGNQYNLGLSYKKIAGLNLLKNNLDLAKSFLVKADSCARRSTSLELSRDVHLLYAELFEKNGDWISANAYLRRAISLNDSMYNVVSLEKTAEIRGLFDLENIELKSKQKEQELALQRMEMDSRRDFYLLLLVILVLVTLLSIIGAFMYISSRKNNRKLLAEIAEKKNAEEQMIKAQINFEEAQALAHLGNWEFEFSDQTLFWSKETYRIFELEGLPAKGLYDSWKAKCYPEDFLQLQAAIDQTIQTGEPFSVEHRIYCNDGGVKYIRCMGEVVKNAEGQVTGLKGTDQDITLQKQAALAKSEFLSSMSHEIRTPINGVIGIAHLLMEENLTPEQKNYVATLQFSAQHLSSIVSDILDFSKIESGNLLIEKVPFNVQEVALNVFKLFENKAAEKHLLYRFLPDKNMEGQQVLGDYVRLSQILANLISNAIKFTEKGYVTLRYVAQERSENRCTLCFEVKDSGIGINHQQLEHIWDEFTQADVSTSRKYGGTGLGLSISKKLVELQGGSISVESAIGEGSTFSVFLTYECIQMPADATQAQAGTRLQETGLQLAGMNVLIAEDNTINVMVLTPLLKKWGATFRIAKDGAEALDIFETERFDVILMDIQMPNVDGVQATYLIRSLPDPHRREVPVIAFTAEASVESHEALLRSGFNDCLTKPFKPEILLDMLKKYHSAGSMV